jgi:hypothetical protein
VYECVCVRARACMCSSLCTHQRAQAISDPLTVPTVSTVSITFPYTFLSLSPCHPVFPVNLNAPSHQTLPAHLRQALNSKSSDPFLGSHISLTVLTDGPADDCGCVFACIRVCVCVWVLVCMCVCVSASGHVKHTHTYTHTHTHTRCRWGQIASVYAGTPSFKTLAESSLPALARELGVLLRENRLGVDGG